MNKIKIEEKNSIFLITLNRPEKRNAFDAEMVRELGEAFLTAAQSKSARAVLLTGAGQSFCAGADLEWMKSMKNYSFEENQKDSEELFDMFEVARNCPIPIVTKAHGHVMGGANGLLAISDIVVAEKETKFAFSEVKIGLVPAVISSFVFRKMNYSSAKEKMLTGRVFNADEALSGGLVEFVSEADEVDKVLLNVVDQVISAGPESIRESIRLFGLIAKSVDELEVRKISTKIISERRVSREGQEGLSAFFEKRRPTWASLESDS